MSNVTKILCTIVFFVLISVTITQKTKLNLDNLTNYVPLKASNLNSVTLF